MAGLIIAAPFILLLLIALAFSMIRGITKSRIRLVCVILCAVAAFLITINLTPTAKETFEANKETIAEQIGENEQVQEIWNYFVESETLQDVVLQVGTALLAPFLFVVLFTALRFATWIIYFIVTLILHNAIKTKEETRRARIPRSMVYGLVQFLIITFVLLAPVYVLATSWDAIEDIIVDLDIVDENGQAIMEDYQVDSVKSNALLNIYGKLGGEALCNRLTSMTITIKGSEDESAEAETNLRAERGSFMMLDVETTGAAPSNSIKTTLKAELEAIAPLVKDVSVISKAGDLTKFTDEQADAIVSFANNFTKSNILTAVLGEVIHDATGAWLEGKPFLGVEIPKLGDTGEGAAFDLNPIVNTLIKSLHNDSTSFEGIGRDINTVAEVLKILIRDDVLSNVNDSDAMINTFGSGSTVEDIINSIGNNPSLKALIPEFTNLGMRAIGSMLSLPENAAEIYEKFIDDIVAALNALKGLDLSDPATIEKLTADINKALEDSGIDFRLEPSMVKLYAETLLADLGDLIEDGVEANDVKEYFEIYAATVADGNEGSGESTNPVAYFIPLDSSEKIFASRAYAGKTIAELKKKSAAGVLGAVTVDIAKESGKSEGTEEEFNAEVLNIMKRHTDAYAEATGNAEKANALNSAMSSQAAEIKKDHVTMDTVSGASKMTSDSFPTVIVTMDQLINSNTAAASEKLNSKESVANEAKAISQIFSGAIDIKDKVSGDSGMSMSDLSGITESLGKILDGLKQTSSVGEENTSKLVTAVFQSKTVSDAMRVDLKTATEIAKQATSKDEEGNSVSYTETLSSIGKGAAIAEKIGKSTEPITEEEIRELLSDMTPQTANMLRVYMTADRMTGYGINAIYAENSALLLKNLFTEMSLKSKYANTYDKQTAAILKIFEIAVEASKGTTGTIQLFTRNNVEGVLKVTAKEAVDIVMDAEMVVNAVVNTVTDENGTVKPEFINPFGLNISSGNEDYLDCVNALNEYYNNYTGDKTHLAVELNAVAALLGVDPIF